MKPSEPPHVPKELWKQAAVLLDQGPASCDYETWKSYEPTRIVYNRQRKCFQVVAREELMIEGDPVICEMASDELRARLVELPDPPFML